MLAQGSLLPLKASSLACWDISGNGDGDRDKPRWAPTPPQPAHCPSISHLCPNPAITLKVVPKLNLNSGFTPTLFNSSVQGPGGREITDTLEKCRQGHPFQSGSGPSLQLSPVLVPPENRWLAGGCVLNTIVNYKIIIKRLSFELMFLPWRQ